MTGTPTLRRDAERNRLRILEAAKEVFAERGLGVSLDDIARHAGVGVGTVYRRFENKDALIEELFESRLAELTALADEAFEIEDSWDALVTFMQSVLELQAKDRGLKDVAFSGGRDRTAAVRDSLVPRVEKLMSRAQADGKLRADVRQTDFPMLGGVMLGAVIDATRDVDPEVWRRYLTIVLDGLRPARQDVTPLPGSPLEIVQIDEVMRSVGCSP